MKTLLLIDDDQDLARLLTSFMSRSGWRLAWAERPSAGRALLRPPDLRERPVLILLDVMLPEEDGFTFCRKLREEQDATPVIMLTARGDDQDRIRGLRLGADDYLPKPFNPHELLARVEAVLRRTPLGGRDTPLDPDRRTLRIGEREIALTPSEYRLVEAMAQAPGRAFSRDQLLRLVEAGEGESLERAIDIHVSRLRSKLEEDPREPRHLVTVRGVGYRFEW